MKFMGSKRSLLSNGLGDLLIAEARTKDRFVDLMTGSAAVSWFVGEKSRIPVLACDLQQFSAELARSVIAREGPVDAQELETSWLIPAEEAYRKRVPVSIRESDWNALSKEEILRSRDNCSSRRGLIGRAYGGHYFAPHQATALDLMLKYLPPAEPLSSVAKASMIVGSSRYVAAPGHTAQPLQPSDGALPYLRSMWSVNPFEKTRDAVSEIGARFAKVKGSAAVKSAAEAAKSLNSGDLVFLDPPYSAVHYSRFYHVYETMARGHVGRVSGVGRYPDLDERPRSDFSMKTTADVALEKLLATLYDRGTEVVLTFPAGESSNGLSGSAVLEKAETAGFSITEKVIHGRFSTLGGNGVNRASRLKSSEMLLVLRQ